MHAATYEIRVEGSLAEDDRAEFEPLRVFEPPRQTVLVGNFADQAALHGVLDRLESLGLRLIEVTRRPADGPP